MKKSILGIFIGVGVFVVLVIWRWYTTQLATPGEAIVDVSDQSLEDTTKEEPHAAVPAELPAAFKVIQDRNAGLRANEKQKLKDEFNAALKELEENPTSFWHLLQLSLVKKSFHDFEGSRDILIHMTKLFPTDEVAYANLGHLYWHELRDVKNAEAAFLKVIEVKPAEVRIYRDLADLYRYDYPAKKGEVDDVILRGLRANPKDAQLLGYLGLYYYEQGETKFAIDAYEQLVQVAPNNEQARLDLEDLKAGRPLGSLR